MKILTVIACVVGIAGGVVGIVVNFGRFREILRRWLFPPKPWADPGDDFDPDP